MRLKSDLAEVLLATAEGRLNKVELKWDPRPAICVVAASGGYPGSYKSGFAISGIDKADALEGVKVFHAGTAMKDGQPVTNGGRVLAVTAIAKTLAEAQKKAYTAMEQIKFDGMHYRRDIGMKAIKGIAV
jgi:phosphoribosylamine--glycine ligase